MIHRKAKGSHAERELVHLFWEHGWAAIRVAGSGSSPLPCPDVVAGTSLRKLAIECKTSKDERKYFKKDEIEQLRTFSRVFGAEAWIGVRFNRRDWHFFMLEDLKETPEGYSITGSALPTKGLLFEELIR